MSQRTTLANIGAEAALPSAVCPSDFGVDVSFDGQWVVAKVRGDLDIATTPTLRSILVGLVNAGHLHVCLDLKAVTLMSAAGLSVVAATTRRLDRTGALVLESVSPHVARVLDICGLGHLTVATNGDRPNGSASPVDGPTTASQLASRAPHNSKKEATWASS